MLCCLTKASDFLSSDLPLFFCFFFFNILFVCLHFFIIIFFSLPPLCCIFDQMCFVGVQFPWNVPQWLWLAVCSLISWSTALFIVIFFFEYLLLVFGLGFDWTRPSRAAALKRLWSCSGAAPTGVSSSPLTCSSSLCWLQRERNQLGTFRFCLLSYWMRFTLNQWRNCSEIAVKLLG